MRLLNTISLSFEEYHSEDVMPYAILSHRWGEEEVSYQDMQTGRANQRKGYKKIERCCRLARSQGYKYVWIDTCCIDKTSSAELTEAINSMFRWYQSAEECYAYLSDVRSADLKATEAQEEFSASVWFTRGWTLQELIAPRNVVFFNRDWECLGQKYKLRLLLSIITSIDPDVLIGKTKLSECPVAQRMAWAARRTTTRLEDRSYSLLGIFNVHMPMLYGEGERAFQRLQEEIIKQSDDQSLFAWKDKKPAKSALAPSPSCFASVGDMTRIFPTNDTSQGFTLKNAGLSIQLQLVPWSMNTYLAPLRCGYIPSSGSESSRASIRGYDRACIFLQQTDHENHFIRVSVDGKDLVVVGGDRLAERRNRFGFADRQILVHQLSSESFIRPANPGFYGFVFSLQHSFMFVEGRKPRGSDVVCGHKWDMQRPVFEIANGRHHSAGMFRIATGHYMYFGFDRDFGPMCLITSRDSRSRQHTVLESDLQALDKSETLQLLDINWLRAQVAEGTATGHAILAFKGERRTRTEIECSCLSLRLVFEWRFSEITEMDGWHVSFTEFGVAKSRDISPSVSEVFDTTKAGITSPTELAGLAALLPPNSERTHHPSKFSVPQMRGNSPKIKVVDFDDNGVRVFRDAGVSHTIDSWQPPTRPDAQAHAPDMWNGHTTPITGGHTNDRGGIRVVKVADRPSGFVMEPGGVDGNRIVRQEQPSMITPGVAIARALQAAVRKPPSRRGGLFVVDEDRANRRRPRSR